LQGLHEAGYIEGNSVAIEYRSVRRQVAAIVATGGTASASPAKAATATIPIIFANGSDPVKLGFVASLNRPGGNVTGVSFQSNALGAERLELLKELVPITVAIGFLVNPNNPNADSETTDVQAAARALGQQLHVENASSDRDIDAAFASFVRQRVNALSVAADGFFLSQVNQIVALAARHAMPTIYPRSDMVATGGLISYGTRTTDAMRQAGIYAGRILKGEKPADLPVVQSTKFELAINLKTAKTLGLTVPLTLQVVAYEVIE
jgi:putative ABC transport system substrate-binding protein